STRARPRATPCSRRPGRGGTPTRTSATSSGTGTATDGPNTRRTRGSRSSTPCDSVLAGDVVAVGVPAEALGELAGLEAVLGHVVLVRTELTARVRVDVLGDRLRGGVVELVADGGVDRAHRLHRIGDQVGVLHVDDLVLGVSVTERVDAAHRLVEHRRPVRRD